MLSDMQEPLIRCRGLCFRYPEAASAVLNDVCLDIEPGRCYCLTGPTGSGKTTLARILGGLAPEGDCEGAVTLAPAIRSAPLPAGLVLQDPDVQLLASTVGAEVAFGLENLAVDPAEMPERVSEALAAAGLEKPPGFPVDALSMGQKYRLLVAALLVMRPPLLILDEPGAQLDREGLLHLQDIVRNLKRSGIAILLCEHRPEPLLAEIDEFWQLSAAGRLSTGRRREQAGAAGKPARAGAGAHEVLNLSGIAFHTAEGAPVWQGIDCAIRHGERVAITGLNGTGKTTLLRCMAGFLKPHAGTVTVLGGAPDPVRLRGRLGLLFQNPQKQLFENTVLEEVAFPLKRAGLGRAQAAERARTTLEQCGIARLADDSPHKLSYGQKHLVALASVLAPRPELLLLDDPLAGLDACRSREVMDLLTGWSGQQPLSLIITSHEPEADFGWADRVLRLEGGRLVEH